MEAMTGLGARISGVKYWGDDWIFPLVPPAQPPDERNLRRRFGADKYLSLQLLRLKYPEERSMGGDGLALLFVTGGAGEYITRNTVQRLGPGDVLAVKGATAGSFRAAPHSEAVFWFFSAKLENLLPLFESEEICRLDGLVETFKSAKHYAAETPVAKECHRLLGQAPPRFGLDHRGHLLSVVTVILANEFKQQSRVHEGYVPVEEHMCQVLERLSLTEMSALSVEELAERFGCSRRHLNRLFHSHFGFSVTALRMEMRLLKAIALLRDPSAKVISVAERCGFNHLGLFNTCFKRRFKVSPGEWRKKMAGMRGSVSPLYAGGNGACRIRNLGLCPWAREELAPATVTTSGPRFSNSTVRFP